MRSWNVWWKVWYRWQRLWWLRRINRPRKIWIKIHKGLGDCYDCRIVLYFFFFIFSEKSVKFWKNFAPRTCATSYSAHRKAFLVCLSQKSEISASGTWPVLPVISQLLALSGKKREIGRQETCSCFPEAQASQSPPCKNYCACKSCPDLRTWAGFVLFAYLARPQTNSRGKSY